MASRNKWSKLGKKAVPYLHSLQPADIFVIQFHWQCNTGTLSLHYPPYNTWLQFCHYTAAHKPFSSWIWYEEAKTRHISKQRGAAGADLNSQVVGAETWHPAVCVSGGHSSGLSITLFQGPMLTGGWNKLQSLCTHLKFDPESTDRIWVSSQPIPANVGKFRSFAPLLIRPENDPTKWSIQTRTGNKHKQPLNKAAYFNAIFLFGMRCDIILCHLVYKNT